MWRHPGPHKIGNRPQQDEVLKREQELASLANGRGDRAVGNQSSDL
jgi:hypothetical protein